MSKINIIKKLTFVSFWLGLIVASTILNISIASKYIMCIFFSLKSIIDFGIVIRIVREIEALNSNNKSDK